MYLPCSVKKSFWSNLIFVPHGLWDQHIHRLLPYLNQLYMVCISKSHPKQPTSLSVYFLQIWGIRLCNGCVILKDTIPIYKGFEFCCKFTYITSHPPEFIHQKKISSCTFVLSFVMMAVWGSLWGNSIVFYCRGRILQGSKRGGLRQLFTFLQLRTSN